jgi:hypothetical protein
MTASKGIAILAAVAFFVSVCQGFATVPIHHGRCWVGQNQLKETTLLHTKEQTDLLRSSKRLSLFVKALHDGLVKTTAVAAPSKPSKQRTSNSIKTLSREILWHAFLSTLLARFCFPRLSLSPLAITVVMSILKRKGDYTVRSHEW